MKPTKRSTNDRGSGGNAPAGIQSLTRSFSMYTRRPDRSRYVRSSRGYTTYTPFISPKPHSLHTQLRFQIICFTADTLRCASVCFHTERGISVFWRVRFIKRSEIERIDVITALHCCRAQLIDRAWYKSKTGTQFKIKASFSFVNVNFFGWINYPFKYYKTTAKFF